MENRKVSHRQVVLSPGALVASLELKMRTGLKLKVVPVTFIRRNYREVIGFR